MVDYGKVRSTVKPEPIVIDEFSVWQHTNIQAVSENVGEENEFVGFEYNMIQFTKDEFILQQAAHNAALQQQITDTQLALCEVYELMG
jgi:hypothetical protein